MHKLPLLTSLTSHENFGKEKHNPETVSSHKLTQYTLVAVGTP